MGRAVEDELLRVVEVVLVLQGVAIQLFRAFIQLRAERAALRENRPTLDANLAALCGLALQPDY